MKKVIGFLFDVHKITGLSIAVLFSMWDVKLNVYPARNHTFYN